MRLNKEVCLYEILESELADDLCENVFPKDKQGLFLTEDEVLKLRTDLTIRWANFSGTMEENDLIAMHMKALDMIRILMVSYDYDILRYIKPKDKKIINSPHLLK